MTRHLRIPAIAAPMFLVSGVDMVLGACRAGIIGSFPANNARSIDTFEQWLVEIKESLPADTPPWAVNIMVHRSYVRMQEELDLVLKHKPPIVITALGSPSAIVEAIHGYGGIVLADVNSVAYARKAAAAGVDGLILVGAGSGGHTGEIAGFAFVPAVREFFDGIIVLGGGIGNGAAIRAAELIGADFAYLGTRFICASESIAEPAYKQMLIEATVDDIVCSAALSGVPANWLRPSLIAAGYDPDKLKQKVDIDLGRPEETDKKRWRDVWSAGQGVGAIRKIEPIADIIRDLAIGYDAALKRGC